MAKVKNTLDLPCDTDSMSVITGEIESTNKIKKQNRGENQ